MAELGINFGGRGESIAMKVKYIYKKNNVNIYTTRLETTLYRMKITYTLHIYKNIIIFTNLFDCIGHM